jgi:hypothetical protein
MITPTTGASPGLSRIACKTPAITRKTPAIRCPCLQSHGRSQGPRGSGTARRHILAYISDNRRPRFRWPGQRSQRFCTVRTRHGGILPRTDISPSVYLCGIVFPLFVLPLIFPYAVAAKVCSSVSTRTLLHLSRRHSRANQEI